MSCMAGAILASLRPQHQQQPEPKAKAKAAAKGAAKAKAASTRQRVHSQGSQSYELYITGIGFYFPQ